MPASYSRPIVFATAAAVLAAVTYYAISNTKKAPSEEKYSEPSKKVEPSTDSDRIVSKDLQEVLKLPLIELSKFFNQVNDPIGYRAECEKVARGFHEYGLLVIKDPRVNEHDNDIFLDMMERYFAISDGKNP
jgi:hypothetical protein